MPPAHTISITINFNYNTYLYLNINIYSTTIRILKIHLLRGRSSVLAACCAAAAHSQHGSTFLFLKQGETPLSA